MKRLFASLWIFAPLAAALAQGCSINGDCNLIGLIDCQGNGICTSLASDVYNCGACGHVCQDHAVCSQGSCLATNGPPLITSIASPTIVTANPDGSHTLELTVWFTDDSETVSDYDFASAATNLPKQPLETPAFTGSVDVSVPIPATTPTGTFAFTVDVISTSGTKSTPFSGSVVLE